MPKLHNFPQSEVNHLSILDGTFSGTVSKDYTQLAGQFQVAVAYACASVSAASTVQVFPFANADQDTLGAAIDLAASGATATGTVTISTGTNAAVEYSETDVFLPFGARVTFSTTSTTGSGTIDAFFRLEG